MSADVELVATIEREVDERLGRVGLGPGVDEVVAGGRVRRRRRRALTGAAVVSAVAMVAGGGALAEIVQQEPPVAPATREAVPFAGCTLEPQTCDAAVVDRWLDGLGAGHGSPSWSRITDEWMTGLAPGAYGYAVPVNAAEDEQAQIASSDGAVVPTLDAEGYVADLMSGVRAQDLDEREVLVPTASGEVTASVVTIDADGSWFQAWVVDDGTGHGGVIVTYEGNYPDGGTPSLGLSAGPGMPTGWTDERVSALISDLLTAPPA